MLLLKVQILFANKYQDTTISQKKELSVASGEHVIKPLVYSYVKLNETIFGVSHFEANCLFLEKKKR